MPIVTLPIFWLMPIGYAVPIYIFIALVSAFLYWLIMRAMRQPVRDGFRSLIGTEVEVVSKLSAGNHAKYLVRSQGELWSANSPDVLQTGETVSVEAVDGIRLVVRRNGNPVALAREAVGKANERHCH